jgi:hypothetical protein
MAYSEKILRELMENPKATEIIDKYVPGFEDDPMLFRALDMDIRSLAPMKGIRKNDVDALCAEIDALEA